MNKRILSVSKGEESVDTERVAERRMRKHRACQRMRVRGYRAYRNEKTPSVSEREGMRRHRGCQREGTLSMSKNEHRENIEHVMYSRIETQV